MIRWTFRIVCAVSLLLCMTFLLTWVAAPHGYHWKFYTENQRHELIKWRGFGLSSGISYETIGGKLFPDGVFRVPPGQLVSSDWQANHELPLGIAIGLAPADELKAAPYFRIFIPLWLLVLATALLPSLWLWGTVRRWRRKPPGLCSVCGYDLRASEMRCPECGTAVGEKTATS